MDSTTLVVYDGSVSGDEGIRLACSLAETNFERLDIVSVSIVPPSLPLAQLPKSFDETARLQLARARELSKEYALDVHTWVLRGYELARTVMQECERVQPSGVFLALDFAPSRRTIQHLPALIRDVMREAPCPVYIAHVPKSGLRSDRQGVSQAEHLLRQN